MSLTTQPPRISNEERLQRINVLRRNLSEKHWRFAAWVYRELALFHRTCLAFQ